VGVYPRTPFEIGQVDGGARHQACRRCRTRATVTGDHGAPVAAIRLTMNALSSAGGRVTATILQAGIGWIEPVDDIAAGRAAWERIRGTTESLGTIGSRLRERLPSAEPRR
jgi:hypothetical protein